MPTTFLCHRTCHVARPKVSSGPHLALQKHIKKQSRLNAADGPSTSSRKAAAVPPSPRIPGRWEVWDVKMVRDLGVGLGQSRHFEMMELLQSGTAQHGKVWTPPSNQVLGVWNTLVTLITTAGAFPRDQPLLEEIAAHLVASRYHPKLSAGAHPLVLRMHAALKVRAAHQSTLCVQQHSSFTQLLTHLFEDD